MRKLFHSSVAFPCQEKSAQDHVTRGSDSIAHHRPGQRRGVQIQLESDADINPGAGLEVAYSTYNSFADLLSDTNANTTFAQFGVGAGFSTTGLAFAGNTKGNGGVIPEPSTLLLFSTGLLGLMGFAWRRKQQEATNV